MTVNCFILIWKGFITNTKKQGKKMENINNNDNNSVFNSTRYSNPALFFIPLIPGKQTNKHLKLYCHKKKLAQPTSPSRGISASGSSPIFFPHRSVLLDVLSCVKSPQKPLLIGGQSAKMELSCGDNPPQTPWKEARHQLVIMREGGGGCTPEMWPGN